MWGDFLVVQRTVVGRLGRHGVSREGYSLSGRISCVGFGGFLGKRESFPLPSVREILGCLGLRVAIGQ